MTDENVKIDGDFVEKENVPREHETHAELNTASLAVRNVVHVPVEIDIEQVKQQIPPFFVPIATNGI